jgi:hypothetical protein
MDLLLDTVLSLWLPILAPPPDPAGCTALSQLERTPGQVTVRQELRYDSAGRVVGLSSGPVKPGAMTAPTTTQIQRDAAGCITELRWEDRAVQARMSCGPDGSLAQREDLDFTERWAPPTRSGDGWTQTGGRGDLHSPPPLRQTWRPLGAHGVHLTIEDRGEVEQDLRLELGAPGPTGPRPPWDHLPAWSSGVTRVVTDAQGRLVAREGKLVGSPATWQVRWSADGRGGEVVFNDKPPAELHCGPGRCEVPALGWTEVWSCPAK